MVKYILIILFFGLVIQAFSQSDKISDCQGAVNIFNTGSYKLQFTGSGGNSNDLLNYPSLQNHPEENSLWCLFEAPFNGRLSLSAKVEKGISKMIIFTKESNNFCEDLSDGIAEIKRMIVKPTKSEIGLSINYDDNFYYPMEMVTGEEVMILFLYENLEKENLDLNVIYEHISDDDKDEVVESKIVDQRYDKTKPALKILIRDVETGNPVVSDVLISGIKSISSFYQGSDLIYNTDKSGKITVKVDAEGYFFEDIEEPVTAEIDHEILILLDPISDGKSIQLKEIEFMPGTSQFLPSSAPKLKRLKDFLALNSEINVEIQGHVQEKGENSFLGQKISEARAKKVLNYLVENGIDKKRLTAKGYGNTMPIYPDPKLAYEEQANRRVEIKIIN